MARDWRLVENPPGPAAFNMAVDHALVERVEAGGRAALRLYGWERSTLSLGRNQPARGRVRHDRARARGVHIVRRPTGGAAVYHDHEMTYAVAVPAGALGSPRETYAAVNRALVASLRRLGVDAALAPGSRRAAGNGSPVCFHAPGPGEVVVAGRKLVGSAQRRYRRALLQHGSILFSGGQEAVMELMRTSGHPGGRSVAALEELLGRMPAPREVAGALVGGFEAALGIRFAPADGVPDSERVAELSEHYGSEAWTWRK